MYPSLNITLESAKFFFFFFNDPATTEIYPLSLHDALPISPSARSPAPCRPTVPTAGSRRFRAARSEEHTSELQSQSNLVCRLLLEKKKKEIACNQRHDMRHSGHHLVALRSVADGRSRYHRV